MLNALDAVERGALIRPRTRFVLANHIGTHWEVQCECALTGKRSNVRARATVNAAGPWVESVARSTPGKRNEPRVRLIKGSHIVVPRLYRGTHAFLLQNPDGRVVFTVPYEDHYSLVGTTDVPFDCDPAQVAISAEETRYLRGTVDRYFRKTLSPTDIKWTYSGVRPLCDDEEQSAAKVTRDWLTFQVGPRPQLERER